jgi:hypothetical protein
MSSRSEMPRWRRCQSRWGARCSAWRSVVCTHEDSPPAVTQLPLLTRAQLRSSHYLLGRMYVP